MNYQYLIAFGSNVEPRLENLAAAIQRLSKLGSLEACSSLYTTDPIGPADLEFYNGVLLLSSTKEPEDMMRSLLLIETDLGRKRVRKWGNRNIDLDILMVQDHEGKNYASNSDLLTVPHPHMSERDFVLRPAAEIAPEWHCKGNSIQELAHVCSMKSIRSMQSNEPVTKLLNPN